MAIETSQSGRDVLENPPSGDDKIADDQATGGHQRLPTLLPGREGMPLATREEQGVGDLSSVVEAGTELKKDLSDREVTVPIINEPLQSIQETLLREQQRLQSEALYLDGRLEDQSSDIVENQRYGFEQPDGNYQTVVPRDVSGSAIVTGTDRVMFTLTTMSESRDEVRFAANRKVAKLAGVDLSDIGDAELDDAIAQLEANELFLRNPPEGPAFALQYETADGMKSLYLPQITVEQKFPQEFSAYVAREADESNRAVLRLLGKDTVGLKTSEVNELVKQIASNDRYPSVQPVGHSLGMTYQDDSGSFGRIYIPLAPIPPNRINVSAYFGAGPNGVAGNFGVGYEHVLRQTRDQSRVASMGITGFGLGDYAGAGINAALNTNSSDRELQTSVQQRWSVGAGISTGPFAGLTFSETHSDDFTQTSELMTEFRVGVSPAGPTVKVHADLGSVDVHAGFNNIHGVPVPSGWFAGLLVEGSPSYSLVNPSNTRVDIFQGSNNESRGGLGVIGVGPIAMPVLYPGNFMPVRGFELDSNLAEPQQLATNSQRQIELRDRASDGRFSQNFAAITQAVGAITEQQAAGLDLSTVEVLPMTYVENPLLRTLVSEAEAAFNIKIVDQSGKVVATREQINDAAFAYWQDNHPSTRLLPSHVQEAVKPYVLQSMANVGAYYGSFQSLGTKLNSLQQDGINFLSSEIAVQLLPQSELASGRYDTVVKRAEEDLGLKIVDENGAVVASSQEIDAAALEHWKKMNPHLQSLPREILDSISEYGIMRAVRPELPSISEMEEMGLKTSSRVPYVDRYSLFAEPRVEVVEDAQGNLHLAAQLSINIALIEQQSDVEVMRGENPRAQIEQDDRWFMAQKSAMLDPDLPLREQVESIKREVEENTKRLLQQTHTELATAVHQNRDLDSMRDQLTAKYEQFGYSSSSDRRALGAAWNTLIESIRGSNTKSGS
jgi:hypothetical protein